MSSFCGSCQMELASPIVVPVARERELRERRGRHARARVEVVREPAIAPACPARRQPGARRGEVVVTARLDAPCLPVVRDGEGDLCVGCSGSAGRLRGACGGHMHVSEHLFGEVVSGRWAKDRVKGKRYERRAKR
jgi:hypothetical protein